MSVSIISTISVIEYLTQYKTQLVAILFFVLFINSINTRSRTKQFIYLMIVTMVVNLFIQIALYYFPNNFIRLLVNDKYYEVLRLNAARSRYFIDMYESALIPLLFINITLIHTQERIIRWLIILLISASALLSSFRTHLLMLIISSMSLLLFIKKSVFSYRNIALVFLFFALIIYIPRFQQNNTSSFTRLVDPSESDYSTVFSRIYYWKESYKIFSAYPVFGIGLSNYYDLLQGKKTIVFSLSDPQNRLDKITQTHPHNIVLATLAETGLVGFIALMLLLGYFIKEDASVFLSKNVNLKLVSISFWSLFFFALLNPPTIIQYQVLFWTLRGLLYNKNL
ncbi:hypothetical protein COY90_00605 [Candidatus Roizmanbacteria bacterium CG_4_10_14_0_8_um_filter_39_9]|uniref:O-antigen ligase-related domain-containing protein n=1 Tax=Candidatus Roizmanbacteria bacterium CG_4_10_14_0_8_um_filter_39_9 TaxID=1974829 RepID=A0A2M7QF10_9BACT|nr:MAG: hypothetical protein COY90_00605 [Candidatus Roizmanbacteria bacterium CG_4_10_14_0_8_um_filter_39_9]